MLEFFTILGGLFIAVMVLGYLAKSDAEAKPKFHGDDWKLPRN